MASEFMNEAGTCTRYLEAPQGSEHGQPGGESSSKSRVPLLLQLAGFSSAGFLLIPSNDVFRDDIVPRGPSSPLSR